MSSKKLSHAGELTVILMKRGTKRGMTVLLLDINKRFWVSNLLEKWGLLAHLQAV